MTGVRVDVLIPVYNAAETLEDSIASIQTQTVTNIRLIVVNDGSSDGTALILHRLAAQDPRITVISTENNGIVDALNTGLEICTAPYLARMDADDLAFPERFAQQIAYLEENRDCIALAGNVWHVDQAGRRTGTRTSFAPEMNADPYWAPSREPYLMHPFLMARTEAVRNVGGYRYVFHAEDTDLYWRLAHDGRLYNLPDLLGEYRLHANSISGASILNGRISAVNSQLSALSERRRNRGEPDLLFPKELLEEYKAAAEIEAILAIASRQLLPAERDYLEIAVAAKLLQLVSYRPYVLTPTDKDFIKSAFSKHHTLLSGNNKIELVLFLMVAHRIKRRKFREIFELTAPGAFLAACLAVPKAALRSLLRRRRPTGDLRSVGRQGSALE